MHEKPGKEVSCVTDLEIVGQASFAYGLPISDERATDIQWIWVKWTPYGLKNLKNQGIFSFSGIELCCAISTQI
jgi:hypothetical protein